MPNEYNDGREVSKEREHSLFLYVISVQVDAQA